MNDDPDPWLTALPTMLRARSGESAGDLAPGDIALVGYFCDCLSAPEPGQRFLARQIRYFSGELTSPARGAVDLGDLNVFPLEPEKHMAALEDQVSLILNAGARPCLVGGDRSGLDGLRRSMTKRLTMAPNLLIAGQTTDVASDLPLIVAADLSLIAGRWLSRPRRLAGLSPHQIIDALGTIDQPVVAAAIFGMAPALDASGMGETRAARDILSALLAAIQRGDR